MTSAKMRCPFLLVMAMLCLCGKCRCLQETCVGANGSEVPCGEALAAAPAGPPPPGKRCVQSLDIWNVSDMDLLRNCSVVDGFVRLLHFENVSAAVYENYQFPELVEITNYLVMYRVYNLTSIGKLFPNLAVIGGWTLFKHYSLVLLHTDLKEVGLTKLVKIHRGGVWISGSPALCYGDTVNWHAIVENVTISPPPVEVTVSKECNKSRAEYCRHCPSDYQYCWSGEPGTCQPRTPKYPANFCPRLETPDGTCVTECPRPLVKYKHWCIVDEECRNLSSELIVRKRPSSLDPLGLGAASSEAAKRQHFPFQGSCIVDCPPRYERIDRKEGATCEPCPRDKIYCNQCKGGKIRSIAEAEALKGCIYINDSLEIEISNERNNSAIQDILTAYLGDIEEIENHLKVSRSLALQSLNFLRNLTIIHGKPKEMSNRIQDNSSHPSFIVTENQNLQELWDWDQKPDGRKFEIRQGTLSFHDNPKLCISTIKDFALIANMSTANQSEVSTFSNGEKAPCHSTNINATVVKTASDTVIIDISRPKSKETSSLSLRYVVYYSEVKDQNLTAHEGPDECGSNSWRISETIVSANETEALMANDASVPEKQTHILGHLEPDTLYAFYVRTINFSGLSTVHYVRTTPARPSLPQDVKAHSNSSSQIVLSWRPPRHPNGNLTHYVLKGYLREYNQSYLDKRNYCQRKLLRIAPNNATFPPDFITGAAESDKCRKSYKCKDLEYSKTINWELEDIKHYQCDNYMLKWLELAHLMHDSAPDFPASSASVDAPENFNFQDERTSFYHNVSKDMTLFSIDNLMHFSEYVILVSACRESYPNETTAHCSYDVFITAKTLSLREADDINLDSINSTVINNETVLIRFDEPYEPNGVILSYEIEYYREPDSEGKSRKCITRSEFLDMNRSLELSVGPGLYSYRIVATSLAGPGNPSIPKSFEIKDREGSSYTTLFMLFTILISGVLIACLFGYFYLKKKAMEANMKLYASVNPDYFRMPYVVDEWEVPRRDVTIVKELGEGTFGTVFEGLLYPDKKKCAVKTVQKNKEHDVNEFLNEASVMKAFSNAYHIVKLLGVVSIDRPPLAIMELMALGDLKSFLRGSREQPEFLPDTKRIYKMAAQIADGMAYLEARKFVHRDLAARNCMVAEDMTVKIGDFGMTRDVYETDYYKKGDKGLLPIRWMAPESLGDGIFTSSSDSWSYGVVLWEIATLAEQPYQGLANEQVLQYVLSKQILDTPTDFPEALKPLMNQCWSWRPPQRPSFMAILDILDPVTDEDFRSVSFYHSEEGRELRKNLKHRSQEKASKDQAQVLAFMSSSSEKFYSPKQLANTLGLFKSRSHSKSKTSLGGSASSYVLTDAYVPLKQFPDYPGDDPVDDQPSTSMSHPTLNGHLPSTSRS
nr:PREDICTED: insulin receptor-like [Bemisia tabaci]